MRGIFEGFDEKMTILRILVGFAIARATPNHPKLFWRSDFSPEFIRRSLGEGGGFRNARRLLSLRGIGLMTRLLRCINV